MLQALNSRRENPGFVLVTESGALNVVVTNATTIYFVFPNLTKNTSKRILFEK